MWKPALPLSSGQPAHRGLLTPADKPYPAAALAAFKGAASPRKVVPGCSGYSRSGAPSARLSRLRALTAWRACRRGWVFFPFAARSPLPAEAGFAHCGELEVKNRCSHIIFLFNYCLCKKRMSVKINYSILLDQDELLTNFNCGFYGDAVAQHLINLSK